MSSHTECAATLVQMMADRGCEVTASDYRPGMVMPNGLEPLGMRCPHGVLMWMEPTPEQRMHWTTTAVSS